MCISWIYLPLYMHACQMCLCSLLVDSCSAGIIGGLIEKGKSIISSVTNNQQLASIDWGKFTLNLNISHPCICYSQSVKLVISNIEWNGQAICEMTRPVSQFTEGL